MFPAARSVLQFVTEETALAAMQEAVSNDAWQESMGNTKCTLDVRPYAGDAVVTIENDNTIPPPSSATAKSEATVQEVVAASSAPVEDTPAAVPGMGDHAQETVVHGKCAPAVLALTAADELDLD